MHSNVSSIKVKREFIYHNEYKVSAESDELLEYVKHASNYYKTLSVLSLTLLSIR